MDQVQNLGEPPGSDCANYMPIILYITYVSDLITFAIIIRMKNYFPHYEFKYTVLYHTFIYIFF